MKYRSDFVTNSSSSSFIIHFKSKKEYENEYNKLFNIEGSEIADIVFSDIQSNRLTYTELLKWYTKKLKTREYSEMVFFDKRYRDKGLEWRKTAEFNKILNDRVNKKLEIFKEEVNHRGYFSIVEYSDDTEEEAMLEQEVLPNCSFVVEIMNNH